MGEKPEGWPGAKRKVWGLVVGGQDFPLINILGFF